MDDRDEKERERGKRDEPDVIPFEPHRKIARDPLPKQAKTNGRPKPEGSE